MKTDVSLPRPFPPVLIVAWSVLQLAAINATAAAGDYHTHELVYNPVTQQAT